MAAELQVAEKLLSYEMRMQMTLDDRMMAPARKEALMLLQNESHVVRAKNAINEQEGKSPKFTRGQRRGLSATRDVSTRIGSYEREFLRGAHPTCFTDIQTGDSKLLSMRLL